MAAGVRVVPAPDRVVPDNALIVVRDISRPFPEPKGPYTLAQVQPICNLCGVQHFHKTYHIQLRAGSAIISTTIWAKLQAMPDNGGFVFANMVNEPPAQGISPGREVKLFEKYTPEVVSPVKRRGKVASLLLGPDTKTARAGEGGE